MHAEDIKLREITCMDCPEDPVEAVEAAIVFLEYARTHAMTFSRKRATALQHSVQFAQRAVEGL